MADYDAIKKTVEEVTSKLGIVGGNEGKIYKELVSLVSFVSIAKAEIAEIAPKEIKDKHLPDATEELNAISEMAEQSMGSIMDAVDMISDVAEESNDDQRERLECAITKIYEASNFHDITAQRIQKIIKNFSQIEECVERVILSTGDTSFSSEKKKALDSKAANQNKDDGFKLDGPQLPGSGTEQDEIDALFGAK